MTKNSKKNKKKNKYLHIIYNSKLIGNNIEDDDIQKDYFVNANTPLAAAKKIWRVNKDLDVIYIKDINTDEIYHFLSSSWTNLNGDKFSLNQ